MTRRAMHLRVIAIFLAIDFFATACTGDTEPAPVQSPGTSALVELDRPEVEPNSDDEAVRYPITIEHAFGTTTISQKPQRVVALGAVDRDVAIALDADLVGVAVRSAETSLPPWLEGLIDDQDVELIAWEPDTYDYEQIAALDPDLILAASDPSIAAEYPMLSAFAPTIGPLAEAMTDTWQETTAHVGAALGQPARAADLIAAAESGIAEVKDGYRGLADKTFACAIIAESEVLGVIVDAHGSMVELAADLGMRPSPSLTGLPGVESIGVAQVDLAGLATVDVDVLLIGAATDAIAQSLHDDPRLSQLPAAENGAYEVVDPLVARALRWPTPLSLHWGLNQISPMLAHASSR